MILEVSKIGKRGTMVIPAQLRKRFGLKDGSLIMAEERKDGILLRLATVVPVETYSNERKAEFLLSTAVNAEDYKKAVKAVEAMGIKPGKIKHQKPA